MANATRITAEQFVRAWMESSSIAEVARRTGYTSSTVHVYASQYRKLGIKLPSMRGGRRSDIDVDDLNRIIREHDK